MSTRIIVKNLPEDIEASGLRNFIGKCPDAPPEMTDVKIVRRSDGRSRRIAFVGFKTPPEARRVLEWLRGSWIQGKRGGSKVSVDWAEDLHREKPHGEETPADSRPTEGPSRKRENEFDEFKSVKKGRTEDHMAHANEALDKNDDDVDNFVVDQQKADDEDISDSEYFARRQKSSLMFDDGDIIDENGITEDETDGMDQKSHALEESDSSHESPQSPVIQDESHVESNRIFVRNLPFSTTENELGDLFKNFGTVRQAHIVHDKKSNTSKGFAFVTYNSVDEARNAIEKTNETAFQGRLIQVMYGVGSRHDTEGSEKPFKEKQEKQRKKASETGLSWASMYMSSDAIMSSIADRLHVSKSELLDPTQSDAGVKVALAETHIINEAKKYFEDEGVNLEALEHGKRDASWETILVKNIAYGTTADHIRSLFEAHGTVEKVLMPPAGTIAIIKMGDQEQGRAAWRGLLYKNVNGSILYLEKGSRNLWTGKPPAKKDFSKETDPTSQKESGTLTPAPDAMLYVKNLNFKTNKEQLDSFLHGIAGHVYSQVSTRVDADGIRKSLGFGFIGFRTRQEAEAALNVLNGKVLDGHILQVSFARRGVESEATTEEKAPGTKIMVKNVPFEATKKDIYQLFSASGQVKSVRLPKRMDRRARGFAFVEYVSKQDALDAFEAVKHTHLLGRHLVLQWAGDDDGDEQLERLREQSRRAISGGKLNRKAFAKQLG